MRKQLAVLILFVMALSLALVACGGGGGSSGGSSEVHVKMSEFKFELDKSSVPAGPVKFVFENAGSVVHEAVLEHVGDTDQPLAVNGKQAEVADVAPGKSATLEWTLDQPGEYQLGCHVPGHYEAGMVAKLTITAR
jgi:uncharacterized cupredoxin-like copper-binding protein